MKPQKPSVPVPRSILDGLEKGRALRFKKGDAKTDEISKKGDNEKTWAKHDAIMRNVNPPPFMRRLSVSLGITDAEPNKPAKEASAFRRLSNALGIIGSEKLDNNLGTVQESEEELKIPSHLHMDPYLNEARRKSFEEAEQRKRSRKLLVEKHKRLSDELAVLTTNTNRCLRMLQDQCDTYHSLMDDCVYHRLRDIRIVIEDTLDKYCTYVEQMEKHSKLSGDSGNGKPVSGGARLLMENSNRLSLAEQAQRLQEERYNTMTERELEDGIALLKEEYCRLANMHDSSVARLEKLNLNYQNAVQYCCIGRYLKLKSAILEASAECLHDE